MPNWKEVLEEIQREGLPTPASSSPNTPDWERYAKFVKLAPAEKGGANRWVMGPFVAEKAFLQYHAQIAAPVLGMETMVSQVIPSGLVCGGSLVHVTLWTIPSPSSGRLLNVLVKDASLDFGPIKRQDAAAIARYISIILAIKLKGLGISTTDQVDDKTEWRVA